VLPVKGSAANAELVLLIGARRIDAGVRAGAAWRDDSLASTEIGVDGAVPDLGALCLTLARLPLPAHCQRVRVVVADHWLGAATLPWSAALGRGAGLEAAARARLAAAGCAAGAHDTVRVDDAAHGAARLVLAYPAALMQALSALAARAQARLDSVLALSVCAWRLAAGGGAAPGALALADDGMLLLARARGARPAELIVRAAPAGAQSLDELWQRQCLRDPQLAALKGVPLLELRAAGEAPRAPFVALTGAGAPRLQVAAQGAPDALDALAQRPRVGAPQLAALVTAALLAAAGVLHALAATDAEREVRARLARASAPPAAPSVAPQWTPREQARIANVNLAIRELNLPFAAILRALAPPKDVRVAVLSVTAAPAASGAQAARVKIIAEAPGGADMARYVAFVGERAPFTGAYLSEHEIDDNLPERPYRFTLEASWTD
jgi:hypothetical protein